MPTSRISGNQIEETTNATLKDLDFAANDSILKLPVGTEIEALPLVLLACCVLILQRIK